MAKDKVIPVRMSEADMKLVDRLAAKTGLPRAEIIRRAYRYLADEVARRGGAGFLLDEISGDREDEKQDGE